MPTFSVSCQAGVPNTPAMPAVRSFQSGDSPSFEYPSTISGVTRDSAGAALGSCLVALYRTVDDSLVSRVLSDASGNYRFDASQLISHYIVAYKAGSPDVEGSTVNTLVGI